MFRNYQFDPKDPAQTHSFEIHGVDVSIVNGLRRVILTDVPVVGFSGEDTPSLDVVANTGRLHNEIILHRFGLIPLHIDEVETDSYQEGQLTYELQRKNTTDDTLNVTTHDFGAFRDGKALTEKELKRMFPADMVSKQPILITRLRPGEELHVKGSAIKKTARFHAGFSPVSLCTYFFMQDPNLAEKATNVLDKERSYYRNEYGDPLTYQFEIEPKIALSPRYLVSKAFDIIITKVHTVQQEIYQELSEKVEIKKGDTGGVDFVFTHEDDTLGNILQSHIHTQYVRPKKQAPNGKTVSYAGYYCPHPLDDTMIMNIRFEDEDNNMLGEYIDMLALATRELGALLQDVHNTWLRFAPKV